MLYLLLYIKQKENSMESLLGLSGTTVSYDIILWLVVEFYLLEDLTYIPQK